TSRSLGVGHAARSDYGGRDAVFFRGPGIGWASACSGPGRVAEMWRTSARHEFGDLGVGGRAEDGLLLWRGLRVGVEQLQRTLRGGERRRLVAGGEIGV